MAFAKNVAKNFVMTAGAQIIDHARRWMMTDADRKRKNHYLAHDTSNHYLAHDTSEGCFYYPVYQYGR